MSKKKAASPYYVIVDGQRYEQEVNIIRRCERSDDGYLYTLVTKTKVFER